MGVALDAIVEVFRVQAQKYYLVSLSPFVVTCTNSLRSFSFFSFLSGARPALPMGVAPEAMAGFLGGDHRLKNLFDLHSFDLACMYKLVQTRSMMSLI
jgi:hypothetical protein